MASLAALTFDPNAVDPVTARPYGQGPRRDVRPLDIIDPKIVARVDMTAVAAAAAQIQGAWAEMLIRYYKKETGGFPKEEMNEGAKGAPTVEAPRKLERDAIHTVRELVKASILAAGKKRTSRRKRTWASIFQVPKNDEVDRAIINCKLINLTFRPPPPLSLAEVGTLLGLLRFFDDAVLATADIRHFFWQLRVPESDRHRFSVLGPDGVLECIALPMGWSWSPWVAQGVAGLVVVEAARHIGDHVEAVPGEGVSPESPPPFWYIRDRESGEVKAIVVIWYDNFLVAAARPRAADDQDWNKLVRKNLDAAMKNFKLTWKRDKKTGLVWDVRNNEANYIGIHVFRRGVKSVFAWHHIAENIAGWKDVQITEEMSLVAVAQVLGVLAWDTHIRLGRRHPSAIRGLMSRVGSVYHELNGMGISKRARDNTELRLTSDELQHLRRAWGEILNNEPLTAPEPSLEVLRLLASDATPTCAAGVYLDMTSERTHKTPSECFDIKPFVDRNCHINVIEIMAAVNTVRRAMIMDPDERNALYAIAVDNTTAVSWFNGKTALDEEAQLELENMDRELDERGSKAWAWWEPTRTEPADEPSKGKPVCEDKVRICRARLRASARVALTQLKLTSFRTKAVVDFD